MHIVPVIDIRNGETVRAVAGRRADYRPLVSPLAASSSPLDVVAGLQKLHPFRDLYVADLDAIEGFGSNRAAIERIGAACPDLRLWVDAGAHDGDAVAEWLALRNVDVVIGSESLVDVETLRAQLKNPRIVLSLDFRGDAFLGPPALLDAPDLWPPRMIVMTLTRIGAGAGPDLARLAPIVACAGARRVYAAGGVRGVDDLARLEEAGAAGALVASALHDGRITASDLARHGARKIATSARHKDSRAK